SGLASHPEGDSYGGTASVNSDGFHALPMQWPASSHWAKIMYAMSGFSRLNISRVESTIQLSWGKWLGKRSICFVSKLPWPVYSLVMTSLSPIGPPQTPRCVDAGSHAAFLSVAGW